MPTLTRKPITADTRFSITPAGEAALADLEAQTPPGTCPRCGGRVATMNLYHGGSGYQPWIYCKNADCDYWKRSA